MLTTPRIRVGERALSYESVYTLGGQEAFRLDAVSWAHSVADDSDNCQPLLRCADASGEIFAEVTPPGLIAPGFPAPDGFSYSGPAAFGDDFAFRPPNAYHGYTFHDFGAVPSSTDLAVAWNQPPGLEAGSEVTWFRSPGAVSMGAVIGHGLAIDASTVTLTLTAPAPAGSILMLAVSVLDTSRFILTAPNTVLTVTDSVGGNALVFGAVTTVGVGVTSIRATNGVSVEAFFDLYQLANPLGIGATITIALADPSILRLEANAHIMTGLNAGNPIGPNPGSSYLGTGGTSTVSPLTYQPLVAPPTLRWVGGILLSALYPTASTQTVDVMLARGGIATITTDIGASLPTHGYTQAAMPRLYVGPGDTLTALAVDSNGLPRVGDVVSDFLIWGVDD